MKQKINYRKILTLSIITIFILSAIPIITIADEDPYGSYIDAGIEYLLAQQDQTTGAWGLDYFSASQTAFVLIKLQDRAYELEMDPFDPDSCPWSENITSGWTYLFDYLQVVDIHLQTAGDPDTNGNTYGVRLNSPDPAYGGTPRPPYETGVVLMAFAASKVPDRNNESTIDINAPFGVNDTFGQIAQEAVDYLAFVQQDSGAQRGGWHYYEFDNSSGSSDNSVGGYAVLGLAAAEDFGCTVPVFVKTELNLWIDYIQNDSNGGSGYNSPNDNINLLKTGNLIFQMTYFGDLSTTSRFLHALDYIGDHWQDPLGVGYGYGSANPPYPYYQTMYCLMKGLEYSGIELIDVDDDDIPEYDWFADLASNITATQQPDGSWPKTPDPYYSTTLLSTVWALLVLEKITPETPNYFTVDKDFRHTNVAFSPYPYKDIEFYLEDFESGCPPTGWMIYDSPSVLNGDVWACNTTPNIPTILDYGGVIGTFMEFDDDDYGSSSHNPSEELISASIDCSMYKNIYLDFDGDFEDMAGGGKFWVNISHDGGITWWNVFFETNDVDPGGWDNHTSLPISLGSFADGSSDLKIKFTYSDVYDTSGISSYGWGVTLDNIRLTGDLYPAELGDLIEYNETEDLYYMDLVVKKNGKVASTNPGQLYAVINMSGPIDNVTVNDHFDYEFDVNPPKVGGGVEIILVDPDGYSITITKDPGVTAEVDNENNWVNVSIELDEQLPSGWNLMIYIKFKTAMKHEKVRTPFDYTFNNTAYVYLNDIDEENEPTIVTADILLTPKR
jgi:hypothetical protein